jgi:hypothetical protein
VTGILTWTRARPHQHGPWYVLPPPNGVAVQLPAHPLTGLPKPPRVAARIHRLFLGLWWASWIAPGATPVGGTAATAC